MRPEPDKDESKNIFLPSNATAVSRSMPLETGAENPCNNEKAAINTARPQPKIETRCCDRPAIKHLAQNNQPKERKSPSGVECGRTATQVPTKTPV
jgi:hypothetical protein